MSGYPAVQHADDRTSSARLSWRWPAPIEPSALGFPRQAAIPHFTEFAMPGYILTGAPGAGKTAVLRLLEVRGYAVVEEAATDVIALGAALGRDELWRDPAFIDEIITLQRLRQDRVQASGGATVFYDRSPVCTLALSRHLGFPASPVLAREVDKVMAEGTYEKTAFLIRNQGFIQPTAARRISYEDSLAFEKIHEQTYLDLGFHLIEVPAAELPARATLIQQTVEHLHP
jgi:predicted ATPase